MFGAWYLVLDANFFLAPFAKIRVPRPRCKVEEWKSGKLTPASNGDVGTQVAFATREKRPFSDPACNVRSTRTRLRALRVAVGEVPSASLRCMESKNGQLAFGSRTANAGRKRYCQSADFSNPVGIAIDRRWMSGKSSSKEKSRSFQPDCGAMTSISCLRMQRIE